MRMWVVYDEHTLEPIYECYSQSDLDKWIRGNAEKLRDRDWFYEPTFDEWYD